MKEKIQPVIIEGKGTASEALVEIQSRFTTQDKAVIYYDLRDTTQTSTMRRLSDGVILTRPYKILSYQKIIVTGDDRAAVLADSTFASNIVFRDRTDIVKDIGTITKPTALVAAISFNSAKEACIFFSKGKTNTFYIDNEDFSKATLIAKDEEMKTPAEAPIYISDGTIVRYWKGKSFDEEFLDAC